MAFQREEVALSVEPPAESADAPRGDDAVAGNAETERIARHERSHGPRRPGPTRFVGDLSIRPGLAVRNPRDGRVDAAGERRRPRQIERRQADPLPREIVGDLALERTKRAGIAHRRP